MTRVLLVVGALALVAAAYLAVGEVGYDASRLDETGEIGCAWNSSDDIGFVGPDPCATERRVVDAATYGAVLVAVGAWAVALHRVARAGRRPHDAAR